MFRPPAAPGASITFLRCNPVCIPALMITVRGQQLTLFNRTEKLWTLKYRLLILVCRCGIPCITGVTDKESYKARKVPPLCRGTLTENEV